MSGSSANFLEPENLNLGNSLADFFFGIILRNEIGKAPNSWHMIFVPGLDHRHLKRG